MVEILNNIVQYLRPRARARICISVRPYTHARMHAHARHGSRAVRRGTIRAREYSQINPHNGMVWHGMAWRGMAWPDRAATANI